MNGALQMFANDALVLELLALLKAHGVRNIVISPGSRHYAFTRSFENDEYFSLHSVVDERSAAFYALGLIQASGEPAAVICTSGTASINYGSAISEAYYQGLPLVAITTDRLPDYLHQMEDQMFDQRQLFEGFIRTTVQLRPIDNSRDAWYCNRTINEALLAARDGGPVHINVPIESHARVEFSVRKLPKSRVIARHRPDVEPVSWSHLADRLRGKRVMIMPGQAVPTSIDFTDTLEEFAQLFNAVVMADHLANTIREHRIERPLAFLQSSVASNGAMKPDVVITFGGNVVFNEEAKRFLRGSEAAHWRIDPDGVIADPFRQLTDVFAVSPMYFLRHMTAAADDRKGDSAYSQRVLEASNALPFPQASYGELAVIGDFISALPEGSALHIANSAPSRMTQLYDIPSSVDVFGNRGVNGIDGCMSTAIGYAAATKRPTFLVIGDLTFFYDMNSLAIRDLPSNLRVLLVNNEGGAIMHWPLPPSYKEAAKHVTAGHDKKARGWVESLDIEYLSATSSSEVTMSLEWLSDISADGARVLEVFTEKVSDIGQLKDYYRSLSGDEKNVSLARRLRRYVGKVLRKLGLRR